MSAVRNDECGSTALVKFEPGRAPGRVDLPPGSVVVAVDGMEKASFEYEAFKAERNAQLAARVSVGPAIIMIGEVYRDRATLLVEEPARVSARA